MGTLVLDPERLAFLEAEGWRAYYEHNWPRMLQLMVQVNREEFHMPWPAAILAAYYTVQAGRSWASPRADLAKTQYFLTRFYRHAALHSGLTFDPVLAGSQEMAYWEVHRRRRAGGSHEEYVQVLTALHSTVFDLSPEQARESAELRVEANEIVIEITEDQVPNADAAWDELKEKLRRCYQSVNRERASGLTARNK